MIYRLRFLLYMAHKKYCNFLTATFDALQIILQEYVLRFTSGLEHHELWDMLKTVECIHELAT